MILQAFLMIKAIAVLESLLYYHEVFPGHKRFAL